MFACDTRDAWTEFLVFAKKRCSSTAFNNWLAPICYVEGTLEEIVLEVPNVFVQDYLLSNFREDLCTFLPIDAAGQPAIRFMIAKKDKVAVAALAPIMAPKKCAPSDADKDHDALRLNAHYRFETYIEGPHNQFVKSAA